MPGVLILGAPDVIAMCREQMSRHGGAGAVAGGQYWEERWRASPVRSADEWRRPVAGQLDATTQP